jgi:hypothetical protein
MLVQQWITPFTAGAIQLVQDAVWEVLGYWVCLSLDQRQLQKQAIVIFASVLQDRESRKGSLFFLLFSVIFFLFSSLFSLRLCTFLKCTPSPPHSLVLLLQFEGSGADTVGPSLLGLWKCTVQ